jgi:DNA-binding NtrC family response regulator
MCGSSPPLTSTWKARCATGAFAPTCFTGCARCAWTSRRCGAGGKDIEILASHILHKFKTDSTPKIRGFTPSAIEALYNYHWPGNVRELINRVRRAIVMAENKLISADDLDLAHFSEQQTVTLSQAREAAEKRAIEAALLRHRHRLNEAAADLNISRVTLYRLMGQHGLRELSGAEDKAVFAAGETARQ